MAYDDIVVHASPLGGHIRTMYFPFEDGETYGKGDVVSLDLDGQLSEGADELLPEDLCGIALAGPSGPGGSTLNNPRTDAAYAEANNDRIPVIIPVDGMTFATKNFTGDGATYSNTAPVAAMIGDIIALALIGGVWGVDQGPANGTQVGRIVDILNVRKESILDTGETLATTDTFWIVFTIQSHQFAGGSTELVAPTA